MIQLLQILLIFVKRVLNQKKIKNMGKQIPY